MLDIETEAICGTKQTAVVRFALAPPAVVRAESSDYEVNQAPCKGVARRAAARRRARGAAVPPKRPGDYVLMSRQVEELY